MKRRKVRCVLCKKVIIIITDKPDNIYLCGCDTEKGK